MAFHDVQFPQDISYGSRAGPQTRTDIHVTDSGAEQRVARWDGARWRFNAAYAAKDDETLRTLKAFYIARRGPLHTFRYWDPKDYTTASDNVSTPAYDDYNIGTGDGSETEFQLRKSYTSGGETVWRNITKPVTDTVKVGIDGVEQTTGWSVNLLTGVVTFTTAPSLGESITAGCEFDVEVRFDIGDELLEWTVEEYDSGSISDLPLIEQVDESLVDADFNPRGAAYTSLSAGMTLSAGDACVQVLDPQAGSLWVKMPDPTSLPPGFPWFVIANIGSYSVTIKDENDATIMTLAASGGVTMLIGKDSGGNVWYGV